MTHAKTKGRALKRDLGSMTKNVSAALHLSLCATCGRDCIVLRLPMVWNVLAKSMSNRNLAGAALE